MSITAVPSAAFTLTLRVELTAAPGTLGRLATAIGAAGASIGAVGAFSCTNGTSVRDIQVLCTGESHGQEVVRAVRQVQGVVLRSVTDRTFELHAGGKICVVPRHPLTSIEELSVAYTPGVGRVSSAIAADPTLAWDLTIKRNTVAVLTDGSAVLGLGDIGPEAALPVMEGKAMLFKQLADVDAFPVCTAARSVEQIVELGAMIAPGFGGINLEDIAAPRCFEIERRLQDRVDVPVFHDDQHGTAAVVLASLISAAAVAGKRLEDLSVVVLGIGAAGVAITRILLAAGVRDILAVDRPGVLHAGMADLDDNRRWVAEHTNPDRVTGDVQSALRCADAFIGVSGPRLVRPEWVSTMAKDAIVFAMANPVPEIAHEEMPGNVTVIGTGRSDYPNQVNNTLVFPGFFRGLLDARATRVHPDMRLAAARALAAVVAADGARPDYVVPSVFDGRVAPAVARAVRDVAEREGLTRTDGRPPSPAVVGDVSAAGTPGHSPCRVGGRGDPTGTASPPTHTGKRRRRRKSPVTGTPIVTGTPMTTTSERQPTTAPTDASIRTGRRIPGWLLPLGLTVLVLVAGELGHTPRNMIGGLAVITGLGMLLGPFGNRLPVVSKIGGGALVCLMVPSVAVALGLVDETTLGAVESLMREANFLYFVICTLVVGSILGMHRRTMLSGLVKIFPPLIVGTLAAVAAGIGVAMAFGYSLQRAFFSIVVPIIGGGIGEGIIPLSAAYASALGGSPEYFVGQLIPAAVIGNIAAIITAGALRRLGERRPHLDGGGQLVRPSQGAAPKQEDHAATHQPQPGGPADVALGVLTITTLFVLGTLVESFLHLPAPVLVIVFSVLLKVSGIVPPRVEDGARAVYKVVTGHFIYPLMIGLGLLYIPLSSVLDVLSVGYVTTCVAVVLTMTAAGFFVGRMLGMYPIDASLVTVCHSGLGGTGDVAILSASQRMVLMPFAQISTRVGGVTTVVTAASLIRLTA